MLRVTRARLTLSLRLPHDHLPRLISGINTNVIERSRHFLRNLQRINHVDLNFVSLRSIPT